MVTSYLCPIHRIAAGKANELALWGIGNHGNRIKLTTMLMGNAGKREYKCNPIQFLASMLAVQTDESKGNKAPFSFFGFPYYLV